MPTTSMQIGLDDNGFKQGDHPTNEMHVKDTTAITFRSMNEGDEYKVSFDAGLFLWADGSNAGTPVESPFEVTATSPAAMRAVDIGKHKIKSKYKSSELGTETGTIHVGSGSDG